MPQVRVLSPLSSGVAQSVERRYIMSLVYARVAKLVRPQTDNLEIRGSESHPLHHDAGKWDTIDCVNRIHRPKSSG